VTKTKQEMSTLRVDDSRYSLVREIFFLFDDPLEITNDDVGEKLVLCSHGDFHDASVADFVVNENHTLGVNKLAASDRFNADDFDGVDVELGLQEGEVLLGTFEPSGGEDGLGLVRMRWPELSKLGSGDRVRTQEIEQLHGHGDRDVLVLLLLVHVLNLAVDACTKAVLSEPQLHQSDGLKKKKKKERKEKKN